MEIIDVFGFISFFVRDVIWDYRGVYIVEVKNVFGFIKVEVIVKV